MTVSRKSFILGTASLSTTTLLAACGRSKSASSTTSGKTISIKHVYGTTEVPADATKVATVAWANQDVLLALGIMPLGFSKQTWGVTDGSGMLPWTKEKVDELTANGAAQPKLFDDDGGVKINPQAVNATKPEVILAVYSGMSKEEYETLSKIAPTVAYPKVAWGTPWRETIAINATAVGKKTEGDTLVADLEKQVADAVAKHPQIKGKAAAFCYTAEGDATKFGYYTTADPRTAFLPDLGMKVPASVEKTSKENASAFNVDISTENADSLNDFDLIVMYGTESDLAAMQANSLLSQVRAIKNGAVAFVGNSDPMAASTNPGPLSIPWGIEKYVGLIATAAGKVK
ncbi:ABC transporter substrate-binding protein [Actinomyces sp. oral taxon 171]|uniref:ABC transporter substrate-binding protein n=1 Tax=Actinomyces sp. oral taxon 171 TaxID=706438 RepID=UPI0001F61FBE|nr:ABC transporter substrate-binding protein [Actinomyces sp. oral taxon 171]EFW26466.1 periplasmic binding protein [Actinomyces sp. oral taxon 171 str. F0337]QCT34232.1 iron-siderophore ABC transporter substrate-binding protein [Actinomyces sp. oral taxon 171 str. F0337]